MSPSRFFHLVPAAALASVVLCAPLRAQEEFAPSVPAPHPLNDTARFLAGLPVSPGSPLWHLENAPVGRRHAEELNEGFSWVEAVRLKRMRIWAKTEIQPRIPRPGTMYYLFGGPDFLSVASIFPEAKVYILGGLEPVGQVPELTAMHPAVLEESLDALRFSLRSILQKGFFETREMREDLKQGSVHGVLPLLYLFLVRTDHALLDVWPVRLDPEGAPVRLPDATGATGVELGFCAAAGGPRQMLYYFASDVSDSALARDGRFRKFLERQERGGSYLKAASFLMHGRGFDRIREVLLERSQFLLQDDSGIPLRYLQDGRWDLLFFGNYVGPVDIFAQYDQPDLRHAYADPMRVLPLPFGTGYRRDDRESTQIFALRRGSGVSQEPAPVFPPPPPPGY